MFKISNKIKNYGYLIIYWKKRIIYLFKTNIKIEIW